MVKMDRSCIMFNCLWQLWDWLDPPVLTSSASMEDKKMAPPPHLQGRAAPSFAEQQHNYNQPKLQYVQLEQQQPPQRGNYNHPGPRSPLLENHHELYGTKQTSELSRQYAIREQMQLLIQKEQQNSIPHSNSSYSIPSPAQDPVLSAPVPPGFNVSVHQAYLRRNPHQLEQQIYQNNAYQPYGTRIQQQQPNYVSASASHTQLLRQQYNELQQMKLQQQIEYQNQAQLQQQQTFAQRQILNQQLHSRQQSQVNLSQIEQSSKGNDYIYNSPLMMMKSPMSVQSPQPIHKSSGEMSSPSSKSLSGSDSRRSSSGTTQALKSPIAQRPPSAPVTMAGWLYKQGSDGLKVWRKRWFVLSEYCLFYYKSQEEDKLLGSVLLPSYQISPCAPDDKILRKFAFKCEHMNMRTYVLAAPDREQMNLWLKALTMASLMQEGSLKSNPSVGNQQADKSANKYNNNPDQDEITPELAGGCQPMYENAPPKPRRSNEGYQSPSPDRLMERYDPNYDVLRDKSGQKVSGHINVASPLPPVDPIYDYKSSHNINTYPVQNSKYGDSTYVSRGIPLNSPAISRLESNKSPLVNACQNTPNMQQSEYSQEKQSIYNDTSYQKMIDSQSYGRDEVGDRYLPNYQYPQMPNALPGDRQNFERRTPDTYGRSAIVPGYYNKGRLGDYEDVYNTAATNEAQGFADVTYHRPLSPMAYEERKTHLLQAQLEQQQKYTPTNADKNPFYQQPQMSSSNVRHKKLQASHSSSALPYNTVPRPHSADFLEYESKHSMYNKNPSNKYANNSNRQPQRPKSSLDINSHDYGGDSYYYSEASYAEKMRQSAHYLRNRGSNSNILATRQPKVQSPPEYIRPLKMPASSYNNEENDFQTDRESAYALQDQNKNLNSNWTLRNKNLNNVIAQEDLYARSGSAMSDGSSSNVNILLRDSAARDADGEFMRSASARLPTYDQNLRDGEGKREESMKRLLEWKQRMLQSPLTRKSTPATLSLARSLSQTKALGQASSNSDKYLSGMSGQTYPKVNPKMSKLLNATYTSYSSDDEERLADVVGREPSETETREQAGRSLTPPPHTTSTAIINTLTSDVTLDNEPPQDTTHSHTSKSNVDEHEDKPDANVKQLEYTDDDLDEILALYEGNEAKPQDNDKRCADYECCEITIDRHKIDTPPKTPPNNVMHHEDHYLPMSPRKMPLNLELLHEDILKDLNRLENDKHIEDSPYVEMSKGMGIESAFTNEELQAYEIVCVSNSAKVEPVYMELNSALERDVLRDNSNTLTRQVKSPEIVDKVTPKSILKKEAVRQDVKSPLPDILMASHSKETDFESDTSDIEEEVATGHHRPLDVAFSRFSLSDNFRPASYYLRSKSTFNLQSPMATVTVSPLMNVSQPSLVSIEGNETAQHQRKTSTSLMDYGNMPSMYDTLFKGERAKRNRISLPDSSNDTFNSKSIPPGYKTSGSYDTDSLKSYNADRGSSRMSIESDFSNKYDFSTPLESSQIELGHSNFSPDVLNLGKEDMEKEKILKRRPLSEDTSNSFDDSSHDNNSFDTLSDTSPNPRLIINKTLIKKHDRLTSHLNDKLKEESHYENIKLSEKIVERSKSRNSNISNSTSDQDTASTSQTVYSLRRLSNDSSQRSTSRSSLPLNSENSQNPKLPVNHTRHASFEQPSISYYSKNGDAVVLKNLNKYSNHADVTEKVGISNMTNKVSKSTDSLNFSKPSLISHCKMDSDGQNPPYYYSDLSSQDNLNLMEANEYGKNFVANKLNNQRKKSPVGKKSDISHIQNPLHALLAYSEDMNLCEEHPNLIAAAAKCVSMELLNAADKTVDIDDKNIYDSNTLKHSKHSDTADLNSINIYPLNYDKTKVTVSDLNVNLSDAAHSRSIEQFLIKSQEKAQLFPFLTNLINQELRYNSVQNDVMQPVPENAPAPCHKSNIKNSSYSGEIMWDEDSLWSENLRRVSHRHAHSLDHLDSLGNSTSGRRSVDLKTATVNTKTKICRDVTYVNDQVKGSSKRKHYKKVKTSNAQDSDENDVYVQLALDSKPHAKELENVMDDGVYEQLAIEHSMDGARKKFEIDREKLRQWDLMSSGLLKGESTSVGGGMADGEGMHSTADTTASLSISGNDHLLKSYEHGLSSKRSFSGSNPAISRGSNRDISIPVRAVSPRVRSSSAQPWNHPNLQDESWNNYNMPHNLSIDDNWSSVRSPSRQSNQPIRAVSPRVRRASDVEERNMAQHHTVVEPLIDFQNLSAGELLGRTHEELVLILIQLRRKQTATSNAIEQCCSQINSVQNRINAIEYLEQKHENLQRLEQLKHHLMELEKHYEKSKPLVHLVDNMVKLGSLYNRGPGGSVPSTLDRLEYNQMIREQALMEQAAEQRRWAESAESLPREHIERRVEELKAMERWVAGEANTLRSLRRERETMNQHEPALQQDLSRVHAMLAENSQKLEQTVAGNARLEQELMNLKLKLQHQSTNDHYSSYSESVEKKAATDATAILENELKRVQQLVGDLQKQRQELSIAVRQLTDKSQTLGLVSPVVPIKHTTVSDFASTSKVADPGSKARLHQIWVETDLDENIVGDSRTNTKSKAFTPLYIDTQTNNANLSTEMKESPSLSDEMTNTNPFSNLSSVEKQEIKTVRIVKRESERRQRDRERSLIPASYDWTTSSINNALEQLNEEENNLIYNRSNRALQSSQDTLPVQPKGYLYDSDITSSFDPPNALPRTNITMPISTAPSQNNNDYLYTSKYYKSFDNPKTSLSNSTVYSDHPKESKHTLLNGSTSPEYSKNETVTKGTSELSPIFTSEAAKQIIIEMAEEKNGYVKSSNGSQHRRQVPKEKRRHYTAPHNIIANGIDKSPDDDIFAQDKWWRARDDVDMERVLRGNSLLGNKHGPPPLIAPPDVVRSTLPLGPVSDHYSEHTIDRLLAAPNKIIIPERYVPEQTPELSPEEQRKRREKVESIKKMLSSTTPSSDPNKQSPDSEDKRQREHLLQLNQILAKQVMEKSKIVAVRALEKLPLEFESDNDPEDQSPEIELPLYQQRDNFFT